MVSRPRGQPTAISVAGGGVDGAGAEVAWERQRPIGRVGAAGEGEREKQERNPAHDSGGIDLGDAIEDDDAVGTERVEKFLGAAGDVLVLRVGNRREVDR